jgi:enoyl-CoA hydratase/carnithine racemase
MNANDGLIELTEQGQVAVVTVNRAAKLNALTPALLTDLEKIARELDQCTDLRAVVLTGAGEKAFCVGADINAWAALEPIEMWRRWVRDGHRVFDAWAQLRLPVIAAINGHAFGGGLELAAVADIRVADPRATFALPEASIATCPGWSGTQRLASLIGPGHLKYLALTGRRIDAQEAQRLGLVQEVASPGEALPRALLLAQDICKLAPVSVQLTKQLIDAGQGINQAMVLEGMAGALAATTRDAAEGLASFRERRPANYRGE